MSKDNILYSIIGLLAGLILGFVITNTINRSYTSPAATQGPASSEQAGSLPPDHPPLPSSAAGSDASPASAAGGPPAEVMSVIEKAKKEPGFFFNETPTTEIYTQIGRYPQARVAL
jgi:hypothetical protein